MKSRTDNISSEAKTSKGIAYDSRWMIISAIALTLFLFCLEGRAQLVSSNPMEYVALAEGNELINSQIKNQIEDQQKTALLQNTIAAEFTQIRQWERKYNCGRVHSDKAMGEKVQQLPENRVWLCFHPQSL